MFHIKWPLYNLKSIVYMQFINILKYHYFLYDYTTWYNQVLKNEDCISPVTNNFSKEQNKKQVRQKNNTS